jgi:hypothetical protein
MVSLSKRDGVFQIRRKGDKGADGQIQVVKFPFPVLVSLVLTPRLQITTVSVNIMVAY